MHELIDRHLEYYRAKNAESTYETTVQNLRHFEDWLAEQEVPITDVSTLVLERYFLHLKSEGYAPKTIAIRFESVRSLFNSLTDRFNAIEGNPVDDLKRSDFVERQTKKHSRNGITYVTPEEVEAMCDHVPDPGLRNELIIRLLWQTGIRKGELGAIELDHLDRANREIEIWSEKSKAWRSVYYQPSLDVLLDQWIDGGYRAAYTPASSSPYLFVSESSEKFPRDKINCEIVKPAAEAADIQNVLYQDQQGRNRYRVTTHALRHGHAVHALKSGIDVRTVQKHLGHANLDMTMQYLQLIDEDVKQAYSADFGD